MTEYTRQEFAPEGNDPCEVKTPPATPQKSTTSRRQNRPPRYYNFERENEVTIKMTDGVNVIVEGSLGADNYKATRALGYLMKVGEKWIAAVGTQRSKLLPLPQAKTTAKAMHREPPSDKLIASLNSAEAGEVDRAALIDAEESHPPTDLMGGGCRGSIDPELRRAILDTELNVGPALQGDDYQLEYYADGYPMLPECLKGGRHE